MKTGFLREDMNSDELIVKHFLEERDHEVREHPLGKNSPPDLLVDGEIAIEVRRLNLHIDTPTGPRPLEHDHHRLIGHLETLFKSFDRESDSHWHVIASFKRPIGDWKKLKPKVNNACDRALQRKSHKDKLFSEKISNGLELTFIRSSSPLNQTFSLDIPNDTDEGCLIYESISKNLKLCLKEKSSKIMPVVDKYSIWWLALVDHIDYCLSKDEWHSVCQQITDKSPWRKILIVSPLNRTNFIEI